MITIPALGRSAGALSFLVLCAACSSTTTTSSGNADAAPAGYNTSSPNAAKCKTACTPPTSGTCSTEDPTPCTRDCVTLTEGLTTACAQCVVEHTRWPPVKKPADGSEPVCPGYEVGKASSADCAASCK